MTQSRVSVFLLATSIALSTVAPARAQAPASPRLFVIVSVDQMRGDYVTRYGGAWSKGLRRLVDGGAWFPLAAYPYLNTVTCAGHATIGTGAWPATHGMVLNQWYDRDLQKVTACTDDDSTQIVAYGGKDLGARRGNSGARLLVPTFVDELRAQSGVAPHIASFSLKPRSAIGMVGHRGDVVMWFDPATGWATSTAYSAAPVPWVASYLASHPMTTAYGTAWTKLLPEASYQFTDDGTGEGQPLGWTRTFPHALDSKSGTADEEFLARWESTPLADAYLTGLAVKALDELQLGQQPGRRDVLAVSYSVLDIVGHAFGPRSHEVQDVLARLDVTLGDLLDALDKKVGRENYVLALTGDHGVAPIPEQMIELGVTAGRISLSDLKTRVEKAMEPALGPGPHVATLVYTDLYFLPGRYEKLLASPETMRAVLKVIRDTPGVARVYRSDLVEDGVLPEDGYARAVAASYHKGRSGDLLIVPDAYYITSGAIATHGTSYSYDSRVPLFFYGWRVRAGSYPVPSSAADIAPTFAYIAGITLPHANGTVQTDALGPAGRAATTTRQSPTP